jgi:hypothetical protein
MDTSGHGDRGRGRGVLENVTAEQLAALDNLSPAAGIAKMKR